MTDPEMQTKIAGHLAVANTRVAKKIQPMQAKIDDGFTGKHVRIELRAEQTIDGVLHDPGMWTAITLSKGDTVSVISPDGLAMADSAMVVKAEGGRCWFSKPLRMVSFEVSNLYSDGIYEVVTHGVGYVIKSLRDGLTHYDQTFATAKAAEHEIVRRRPVKVA